MRRSQRGQAIVNLPKKCLKREKILSWNSLRNVKQYEDRSEFGQIGEGLGLQLYVGKLCKTGSKL